MGTGDGARVSFGPQLDTLPEIYTAPGSNERHSPRQGSVPVPPVTSVQPEASDNLLEALRGASIMDEHRVLMDTVVEKVQIVKSGLTEACTSLLTGFEKLERAEEELGRVKKQLEDSQGATVQVETLKKVLAEAEDKVAKERVSRAKHKARAQESELMKARQSAQDARAEAQSALQEIEMAKKIAAGKFFTMRSGRVEATSLVIILNFGFPGAFTGLPHGASDAAVHYRAEEGMSTEKLFWSQYLGSKHLVPFSNQLKQLVELHRLAELTMRDFIVRLWPADRMPGSYFRLVQRLGLGNRIVVFLEKATLYFCC
ncbi:uncharacterized protein [Aegilops tauschii subsp. strangulata]|uniref:uncharacterized protein n=1 Tax=Aegilops tauschii subsp. strangulata TaxID=200361 RepID=UPI003CC850F3